MASGSQYHSTTKTNAANDNDSDDEVKILPYTWGEDKQRRMEEQAMRNFPEDWKRIVTKHGAVEYVMDEKGENVIGLEEPVDFLHASDKRELRRLHEGNNELSKIERPLTASGLVQVAKGQLAFQVDQWKRMKTEPGFFYDLVVKKANSASEQLPLSTTGKSLKAQDMLASSTYVALQVRYLSHNHLLDIASWSVILAYFEDIEKLDEEHGRFGMRHERGILMSQVKKIMGDMEFKKYRELISHVILLPEFLPYAVLSQRHDDFAGGITDVDLTSFPNINEVLREVSLRGTFVRMLVSGFDRTSLREPFNRQLLDDLSNAFSTASAEDKQALGPELLAVWGDLEQLTGIIIRLGTDGEDPWDAPEDKRRLALAANGKLSETIFKASLIEKPIKSAESLKSEAVLKKIWDEVQRVSLKKSKKTIEEVLAFAPVLPTWSHKPATIARPQPVATLQPPQPPAPPRQVQPPAQPIKQPDEPAPSQAISLGDVLPPSDTKPRPVPVYTVPNIPESTPPPAVVKAPKVKRRGVPKPSPQPPQSVSVVDTQAKLKERSVYCVGKEVYDTFYKLFVKSQSINWVDFVKAMTFVEFSVTPSGGSAVKFDPPDWANTSPFLVHRPHESQIAASMVRNFGTRLRDQYGWTIDWFSSERPGSELEGSTV